MSVNFETLLDHEPVDQPSCGDRGFVEESSTEVLDPLNSQQHTQLELEHIDDGGGDEISNDQPPPPFRVADHAHLNTSLDEDEDEWKLEALIKKKMNSSRSSMATGEEGTDWIYLCKWKGYSEPTWETRGDLEDLGWISQLNDYDSRGNPEKSKAIAVCSQKNKASACASRIASFFAPDENSIAALIALHGCSVHHYAKMNEKFAERFCTAWDQMRDLYAPRLVFHGTNPENFISIFRVGLLVGVDNASLFSTQFATPFEKGICASFTPETASIFALNSLAILVCVGLVPLKKGNTTKEVQVFGDYIVFQRNDLIYPLWLVQHGGREDNLVDSPTEIDVRCFATAAKLGFDEARFFRPRDTI